MSDASEYSQKEESSIHLVTQTRRAKEMQADKLNIAST